MISAQLIGAFCASLWVTVAYRTTYWRSSIVYRKRSAADTCVINCARAIAVQIDKDCSPYPAPEFEGCKAIGGVSAT